MALANGLLGVGMEEDPNLFQGGGNVLAEIDKVRMQTGADLLPSEMTASGGDLAAANEAGNWNHGCARLRAETSEPIL
jgi:hypothetical protein